MNRKALLAAGELADAVGEVIVATADGKGQPHVAAARRLEVVGEGEVAVSEWFCPGTLANVERHPFVSLVIWDREADAGYQLLGAVTKVESMRMMDGYDKYDQSRQPMPQVERQLTVKVEKIIDFSRAPHTDVEE